MHLVFAAMAYLAAALHCTVVSVFASLALLVRCRVRLHALHCPAALAGAVSLLLCAVLVDSSQRDMSKTSACAFFSARQERVSG